MSESKGLQRVHLRGAAEDQREGEDQPAATVETCGGKVGLAWHEEAGVTAFGPWPCFVAFLKTSGLLEAWVKDCPLSYVSPSAGQSCCAATPIGAANKRCWEPNSAASAPCFDYAKPPG